MDTFEQLDLTTKYEILKTEGSRVFTISHQSYCVTLFLLDGTYFESYYGIDSLKIERIIRADFAALSKYLDYITIYDLYWL